VESQGGQRTGARSSAPIARSTATAIGAAMPRLRLPVTAASATLPAVSSRLPTTSRMRLLLRVVGLEEMTQRLPPSKLVEAGRHLVPIKIKDDECLERPKIFTHDSSDMPLCFGALRMSPLQSRHACLWGSRPTTGLRFLWSSRFDCSAWKKSRRCCEHRNGLRFVI
jgi:hypothetical protein